MEATPGIEPGYADLQIDATLRLAVPVAKLQQASELVSGEGSPGTIDSWYDAKTADAGAAFQRRQGWLTVDGNS